MAKYKCSFNQWPAWGTYDLNMLDINKASLPFNLSHFCKTESFQRSGWTKGLWSLKFPFKISVSDNVILLLRCSTEFKLPPQRFCPWKLSMSAVSWYEVSFKVQLLKFLFSRKLYRLFLFLFSSLLMIDISWLMLLRYKW